METSLVQVVPESPLTISTTRQSREDRCNSSSVLWRTEMVQVNSADMALTIGLAVDRLSKKQGQFLLGSF